MSSLDHRTQAAQTDSRRSARFITEVPAIIRTVIGNRPCSISNISDFGARLAVENPPPAGIAACLVVGEDEFFCTVKWSEGDTCGVEFDRPIGSEALQTVAVEQAAGGGPIAKVDNIQLGRRRGRLVTDRD